MNLNAKFSRGFIPNLKGWIFLKKSPQKRIHITTTELEVFMSEIKKKKSLLAIGSAPPAAAPQAAAKKAKSLTQKSNASAENESPNISMLTPAGPNEDTPLAKIKKQMTVVLALQQAPDAKPKKPVTKKVVPKPAAAVKRKKAVEAVVADEDEEQKAIAPPAKKLKRAKSKAPKRPLTAIQLYTKHVQSSTVRRSVQVECFVNLKNMYLKMI
jgi:hypothetical protein